MTTPNTYTRTLPTEPGFYWWRKDEKTEAILLRVHNHFDQLRADFYQGWKGLTYQLVSDMPGLWCPAVAPELPGEEAFPVADVKVGDRIKFLKTLTQAPTGDTPEFIFCRAGEFGTITAIHPGAKPFDYSAKWDNWKAADFLLHREEFELAPLPVPPLKEHVGAVPTLDELRAKYLAKVADTQREIRESSQMTAADMSVRVGSTSHPSALPQETPRSDEFASLAKGRDLEIEDYYPVLEFCRTLERELLMAEDAAEKGRLAREQCGGMEMELTAAKAEAVKLRLDYAALTRDLRGRIQEILVLKETISANKATFEWQVKALTAERDAALEEKAHFARYNEDLSREIIDVKEERDAALAQVAAARADRARLAHLEKQSWVQPPWNTLNGLTFRQNIDAHMNPLDSPSKPQ